VVSDAAEGDSISVNGCCLTVTTRDDETFTADVMRESLVRTSLGALAAGAPVNLERAVTPTTRLGGHVVQGHVDGTGQVVRRTPSEHWELVEVSFPARLAGYLVEKGSIAVDGVSLTVAALDDDGFEVALIPHTLVVTTLGYLESGDDVNLEADVLAKVVERLVAARLP
jgi:riboflavin synthase